MRNAIINLEYYAATSHRNLHQIPTLDSSSPLASPFRYFRVRVVESSRRIRAASHAFQARRDAFDERVRCITHPACIPSPCAQATPSVRIISPAAGKGSSLGVFVSRRNGSIRDYRTNRARLVDVQKSVRAGKHSRSLFTFRALESFNNFRESQSFLSTIERR